jgi:hypothetical protein
VLGQEFYGSTLSCRADRSSASMRIFVSKKLRALMNFVPVEAPTSRISLSAKALEFRNTLFGISHQRAAAGGRE